MDPYPSPIELPDIAMEHLSTLPMPTTSQIKPTHREIEFASSPFNTLPIYMKEGGWVPDEPHRLNHWIRLKLEAHIPDDSTAERPTEHPQIKKFRRLIEDNPEIFMGFHRLFERVPHEDPLGHPQVDNYDKMLRLFNGFLNEAPEFDGNFLVFLPFTAALQWPMSMANGLTILINPEVNNHFRQLFVVWSTFLQSPESRYVLGNERHGWLSAEAMKNMPNFKETFICRPTEQYWGFTSWDDFFARRLKPGARRVARPGDSAVITSACESKVLRIVHNVQERDQFWIKSQPYSLVHMLNNNALASSFIGGTVYQAFLSPFYYHRWSSPVDGVVKFCELVPGTYFAGVPSDNLPGVQDQALQNQQPFLAHVATRALIFIQANDARIGLVCFVGIGMVEVSSCEITVERGDEVKKGDEIGTFHFGGSTHCLVFGPATKLHFHAKVDELIQVNSKIAQLEK